MGFPLKMLWRSLAIAEGGLGAAKGPQKPTVLRCSEMHSDPLRMTVLSNEMNGPEHALVLLAMLILV